MKPILLIAAAALGLPARLEAQSTGKPGLPVTTKTTSPDPLSAQSTYSFGSGKRTLVDSVQLTWSGGRTSGQYMRDCTPYIDFSGFDEKQTLQDVSGSTVLTDRINNTYNTSGKVITSVSQIWKSGAWVNDTRASYTYTGARTVVIGDKWDPGTSAWMTTRRVTSDSTAGVRTELSETRSGSAWVNESSVTSYFSGAGMTESVAQNWKAGAWENTARNLNTYSGSDLTEYLQLVWNTSSGSWENTYRSQFTYAGPGKNSTLQNDKWNKTTLSWDHQAFTENTWTSGNITEQRMKSWDEPTASWQLIAKLNFTYSGSDVLSRDMRYWDKSTATWIDADRISYEYNSKNQLTYELYTRAIAGGTEKMAEKYHYYAPASSIQETAGSTGRLKLYPNPAINAQAYLDYVTTTADETRMELTDLSGKVLYRHHEAGSIGDHSITIPVAALPKGTYLVVLHSAGNMVQTLKLQK